MSGVRVKYTARFRNSQVEMTADAQANDRPRPPTRAGLQGFWRWRITSTGSSTKGH